MAITARKTMNIYKFKKLIAIVTLCAFGASFMPAAPVFAMPPSNGQAGNLRQMQSGNAEALTGAMGKEILAENRPASASGIPFSYDNLRNFINRLSPHLQKAVEEGTKTNVKDDAGQVEQVSLHYPFGCSQAAFVAKELLSLRYENQIEIKVIGGYHNRLVEQELADGVEELPSITAHYVLLIKNVNTGEQYYLSFFEGQFKFIYKNRPTKLAEDINTGELRLIARPDFLQEYKNGGFDNVPPLLFKIENDDDILTKGGLKVFNENNLRREGPIELPSYEIDRIIECLPPEFKPPIEGKSAKAAAIGQKDRIYLYSLKAIREFMQTYGYLPEGVVYAPSRINIIGEHIDYVDYLPARVLPFASAEYGMFMAFSPKNSTMVQAVSTKPGFSKGQFYIKRAPKGENWLGYLARRGKQPTNWASYMKGSYFYLQNQIPDKNLKGMDSLVVSNIPVSSGASSSSALTVASGYAFRMANGLPIDLDELAESSSKAEWFIGTRGGKMDQATISLGQADKALSMRFEPFSVTPITIPNGYKIITFFTTKHAGGSQLDSEYNERSSISRFVIPSALEEIFTNKPKLRAEWEKLKKAMENNELEIIAGLKDTIEEIINLLPESLTLEQIKDRYPSAFAEIEKEKTGAYKALFELKQNEPLKIRDRSRHHIEEIIRVIKVEKLLVQASEAQQSDDSKICEAKMQEVGKLLNETHASLRDLYNLSTPDIEEVIKIVHGIPGVFGARLMGGGFGGNVEVLVKDDEEAIKTVIQAVRDDYYIPHGRDGIAEGSINIHTPGNGASHILTKDIKGITVQDRQKLQRQLIMLLSDPFNIGANRELIDTLIEPLRISRQVLPVIIAAGKGSRYQNSLPQGTKIHSKVVAKINGKPSIRIVLETIKSLYDKDINFLKPVVIYSQDNEQEIKEALAGYDVDYILQDPVVGTGHSALQLRNKTEYRDFNGDLLIFYSTNPAIRPETLSEAIKIKQALDHLKITNIYNEPEITFFSGARCALVYPATWRRKPYAPLKIDSYYKTLVLDSQETHLEGAQAPNGGLDNIGAYIVDAQYMFETLGSYDTAFNGTEYVGRPNGELGLPNTLGHDFPLEGKLVIAAPIADERESIGIKTYADTKRAEKAIAELEKIEARALGDEVEQKAIELFGAGTEHNRQAEIELENFLVENGEEAIRIFVELIEKDRQGKSIGPWQIPAFGARAPQPGLRSISIRKDANNRNIVYEVPQDVPKYLEQERLKIMAQVAIQRALGRRIVVDFGIGFVGVAELAVGASSKREIINPVPGNRFRGTIRGDDFPTFMIGKDLLDSSSLFKIEDIKRGYSPIRADDPILEPTLMNAHNRGNLTATFLDEIVAVADTVLLSIPQHPYKIMPEHPEMIFADPSAGLKVLETVARLLPPNASCLVESTVFPLYIDLFATPVFEEALKTRGLPSEQWPSLVYSFQRLEPGINWLRSNREQTRMGGATTKNGAEALKAYFESIGYKYSLVFNVASAEYTKDSENAIRYQVIAATAPIQTICEELGLDIYKMSSKIAAESPDKTKGAVLIQATLFPGGYCVPEQLGHLIYGLIATKMDSELDIMQTYYPALANIVSLRMRPEHLASWIISENTKMGKTPEETQVCVMGVTYNPQIDDARNGQSEILVRALADFGVTNITAIDPYAANWPQLQLQQRYSPECESAQGKTNQEWLKGIRFISDKDPYSALTPQQDVVVLATEHPQFIGKGQPEKKRTDGKGNVWPGIDAVKMTARMLNGDDKIIIDTHNFLSDEDIKEFLALGWTVRSLGRGDIEELKREIAPDFQHKLFARLTDELRQIQSHARAAGIDIDAAIKLSEARAQQALLGQPITFGQPAMEREDEIVKKITNSQANPRLTQMSARYEELGPLIDSLAAELEAGLCIITEDHSKMLRHLERLSYMKHRIESAISDSVLAVREILNTETLNELLKDRQFAALLEILTEIQHTPGVDDPQDIIRDALIAQLEGANASFQDGSVNIGTNFYPISETIANNRPRTHGALNLQPGIGNEPDLLYAAQRLQAMLQESGQLTDLETRAELFGYQENLKKLEERPQAVAHTILTELAGLGLKMKDARVLFLSTASGPALNSLVQILKSYGCVDSIAPTETNLIVFADRGIKDIDPVKIVAQTNTRKGGLVFDADNVLTDEQIMKFIALGWRVAGIGKGHIYDREVKDIKGQPRYLHGLSDRITPIYEPDVAGALNEAQLTVVTKLEKDLAARCRLLAKISKSLNHAIDTGKVNQPVNARQLLARLRGISYMNYALDLAVVDSGRAVVELLNEEGVQDFNSRLDTQQRKARGNRLELPDPMNPTDIEALRHAPIPDSMVRKAQKRILEETGQMLSEDIVRTRLQDLFYRRFTAGNDIKVLPAVFIRRGPDGKHLQIKVDPDANLAYYSVRFIMDVARGKRAIPDDWVKYTVLVPLYVVDCSPEMLDESTRKTSNYFITELLMNSSLSKETRDWLINEVLEKGKILTTIKDKTAVEQSRVAILAPVNPYADIDSKTGIGASGRAGILVSIESGHPEVIVTKDDFGREQLIEIKGIGPLLGDRSPEEVTGMSRQIAGGVKRDADGKAVIGQTTVGQVHGLVRGGDSTMIEILMDQPAHKENGAPAGVAAAVFYSFPWLAGQPLSQVWRTISSTRRLGHMPMGGEEDYEPVKIARDLGWNAAEMLAGLGSAPYVHIAAGLDNIREGYFTDEDSLVDIANERDPRLAFNYYFDWTMRFVLHGYNEAKSGEIGTMHFEYLPNFMNGFLEHLFELPIVRDNPQMRERLMKYHSLEHFESFNIEEFMNDVFDFYVAYRVFRTRLENGYNPTLDSAYTSNIGKKFRTQGAAITDGDGNIIRLSAFDEVNEFLTAEENLLNQAEHAMKEDGYETRSFDFDFARQILTEKRKQADKLYTNEGDEADFKDIYKLGYYRAHRQFVHGIIDVQRTSHRVASALMHQTGALDKAAVRAGIATQATTITVQERATGEDKEEKETATAGALGMPKSIAIITETTMAGLRKHGVDTDTFQKYAMPAARELSHIAYQDTNMILDEIVFRSSMDALEKFFIKLKENDMAAELPTVQPYINSIVIVSKRSNNKSRDFGLNLDSLADLFIKLKEKNIPVDEHLDEGIRLIARVAKQEIFTKSIKFAANNLAENGISPGSALEYGVYSAIMHAYHKPGNNDLETFQIYLSRIERLAHQIQILPSPENVWPLFIGQTAIDALENAYARIEYHPPMQPTEVAPNGHWAERWYGQTVWVGPGRYGDMVIDPKPAWLEILTVDADAKGKDINPDQANSIGNELGQHPVYQVLKTIFTSESGRRSEGELQRLIEMEAADYGMDSASYLNNDIFTRYKPDIITPEYVDRIRKKHPPKIVVQSGGNGSTFAIRVAKELGLTVCSLSPVSDDGGGSGKIREELNTEPPGDLGYQLSSLADPAIRAVTHQRIQDDTKIDGSEYTAPELFTDILIELLDGQESEYNLLLASRAEGLKPIAFMRDLIAMAKLIKNTPEEKVFNSQLELKGQTIQNLLVTTCMQVAGAIPDEKGMIGEGRQKVAEFLAAELMQIPPRRGYAIATSLGPFLMNTNRLFAIYKDELPADFIKREFGHIKDEKLIRTILWDGKPRTMIIGEANFGEQSTRHNSKIIFNGVLQGNQYTRIVENYEDAASVISEKLKEEDKLKTNPAAIWAVNSAPDAIIIAPGSPLTSIWPIISTPEILAANIAAKRKGVPIIQFINPMHTNEDLNLSLRDFFELISKTVNFRAGTNITMENCITDIIINDYENTPAVVRRVLSGERILYLGEEVWDPKSRGIYNTSTDDIAYLQRILGKDHVHIAPLVHLFRSTIVGNGVTQHAYRANYIVRMTSDYVKDLIRNAATRRTAGAKASGAVVGEETKRRKAAKTTALLIANSDDEILTIIINITQNSNRPFEKIIPLINPTQEEVNNVIHTENINLVINHTAVNYGYGGLLAENIIKPETPSDINETVEKVEQWL